MGRHRAWWVNYIGHPIHGAAAGYIWLDHDPSAPVEIGLNRRYWSSRALAMAWSASYSLQFEIGPLSEASIGNVGMRSETTGWVDHVITPAGAFGLIVAEDALDRYLVVRWAEQRITNRFLRIVIRLGRQPRPRPVEWCERPGALAPRRTTDRVALGLIVADGSSGTSPARVW